MHSCVYKANGLLFFPPHSIWSLLQSNLCACVCVQVVDDEESSSPEWDRVYPLLDSPSEEEIAEFEAPTQVDNQKQPLSSPPPAAAVIANEVEDLSKLETLQETRFGEGGEQESKTLRDTTHDSGDEAEELGGTTVSQESQPEGIMDARTCGENIISTQTVEFWGRTLFNRSAAANYRFLHRNALNLITYIVYYIVTADAWICTADAPLCKH